jgi:cation diffusion facilitator CzcD-associated flavoprotein CzcO
MQRVASQWGLHRYLRLNTAVEKAHFHAPSGRWRVSTSAGDTLEAEVLVCSTGPLSQPRYPAIAGLESFGGVLMHSARWRHDYDFRGKAVGVIGSAASAVQIVPQLARSVRRLHLFQRTPNWVVPRRDRAYRPWETALLRLPGLTRIPRWLQYWWHEANRLGFNQGTRTARFAQRLARAHLERQVRDPALRAKLTPDYPLGCKRVLLSDDFYPALGLAHVELVTDPIERVDATGIATRDGAHRALDAIVCATGFDTQRVMAAVDVRGLEGQALAQAWREAPLAYHGLNVAGFPNLFLLLGPNTGTGHTSTLLFIEAQVDYALACMRELRRRGKTWLTVRSEAMERHNRALQQRLAATVWAAPCSSWYKTPAGHIAAIYPGFTFEYTRALHRPCFDDYAFG